jgi:hypothetical protein
MTTKLGRKSLNDFNVNKKNSLLAEAAQSGFHGFLVFDPLMGNVFIFLPQNKFIGCCPKAGLCNNDNKNFIVLR